MMDNWEKWWPIFLFQDNSSCEWKERTKNVNCMTELVRTNQPYKQRESVQLFKKYMQLGIHNGKK